MSRTTQKYLSGVVDRFERTPSICPVAFDTVYILVLSFISFLECNYAIGSSMVELAT